MKKFLCAVMLCVVALLFPVEAFAWSEGAAGFPDVMIAAARPKKKAPAKKATAKKQSGPVTTLSRKQYDEFVKICEAGSLERFKTKLERENISPNAIYSHRGWGDNSLLTIASEHSSIVEIVSFLLSLGADVNPKTGSGHTNLPLARATFNKKNVETIFQILLQAGANVNAREDGWTALMLAADKNGPKAVKLLLDAGADVNAKDGTGQTALMYAARNNTPEVIEILLDAGASAKIQAILPGMDDEDEIVMAISEAQMNPKLKGTKTLKRLKEASR